MNYDIDRNSKFRNRKDEWLKFNLNYTLILIDLN